MLWDSLGGGEGLDKLHCSSMLLANSFSAPSSLISRPWDDSDALQTRSTGLVRGIPTL